MTGKTITRADLSESVYQEVGLSRNESAELVDTVLEEISAALTRGGLFPFPVAILHVRPNCMN